MTDNEINVVSTSEPSISTPRITIFVDDDKNTRLHYAAAHGHLDHVAKEIEDGHEVDPVNYLGWTPLMMATRYGHLEVIEFLLEKRADSTRKNSFGYNIFLMAIASGNLAVVHKILEHLLHGGVSRQSLQSVFSPISLAILTGNTRIIQYLIDKKFCINTPSSVGITPLSFARATGNIEIINLFLARGFKIKPNTFSSDQSTQNATQATQIGNPPLISPLVFVSQPSVSPQPPVVCFAPTIHMPRRCSDMTSPYFSPNITPISGGFVQQVFFPPNFTPHQFLSPVPMFADGNEFLNTRLMPASPYCSPIPVNIPYNTQQ